jgi:shikimate dehydrogenase
MTRIAGVIGWPVAHSRSPALHGFWLREHGIDGAYLALPVRPGQVAAALRGMAALGMRGCNVTVPHKEAAAAAVDRLSETAKALGAVNLVTPAEDGSLHGDNTDGAGWLASLDQEAPGWRLVPGPAVVLGAGGAARAIVAALRGAGRPVRLLNRTGARAQALAGAGVEVLDWAARDAALDGAALLVNTTTQGMQGQPKLEIALHALPHAATVSDIVYVPMETELLAAARARGNPVVSGLGMLLHQAVPAFAAFYGPHPEVTPALREAVAATLRA